MRVVPIPPALVTILLTHLDTFGTAPDGRLFFGVERGENVPGSVYTRIWEQARNIGLTPAQAASPLARVRTTCDTLCCRVGSLPEPRRPTSPSVPGTPSRCS